MKKLLFFLTSTCVGIGIGGIAGWHFAVIHWGLREGKLSQFIRQQEIMKLGTNAFMTYVNESPDAGIYALKWHLKQMDEERQLWGTNTRSGVLTSDALNWMCVGDHVRLANLYQKLGQQEASSNQVEAAWQALHQIAANPRQMGSKEALVNYFKRRDAKGEW